MKYSPLVFLAAFFALSSSWFSFVLAPQFQIGREAQSTNVLNTAELYPQSRPGQARQGLEVYRANGCVYCHSLQVGQTGTEVNLILASAGTNPVAVAEALLRANVGLANANATGLAAGLPKAILSGISIDTAKATITALKGTGAEARIEILPTGPDLARGWGARRTVAQDFLYDHPVLPGSQRVGPDLANVGLRLPDENWQLCHLYAPRTVEKDSSMPSYRFLFERKKIGSQPSPEALRFPAESPVPAGEEVVPKPEAKSLVAYLLSLRAGTPLFETPMTLPPAPAPAATNAPAK
jgi:cbb3-type cytochrome oxidase cytochrome c subunit